MLDLVNPYQRVFPNINVIDFKTRTILDYAKDNIVDHLSYLHNLTLYKRQPEVIKKVYYGSRELIVIHREYGKSTIGEDVAANDLIYSPNKSAFVLYVSATLDGAVDHTRAIKNLYFEEKTLPFGKPNPLTQLQPTVGKSGVKWADDDFVLANGNRIMAVGFDKHILGKRETDLRPTRIIIDDPVRKESGYDESSIKTLESVILPMGGPLTRVCVIGTTRRYSDLIMYLKEDADNNWNLTYIPAILEDGTIVEPEYWARRGSCCFDPDKKRFPCGTMKGMALVRQHVKQRKRDVKDSWNTEYLLNPLDENESLFKMARLKRARKWDQGWDEVIKRYNFYNQQGLKYGVMNRPKTIIGCDFAIGESAKSDFSVFTVGEIVPHSPLNLIYAWRGRGVSYDTQKKTLLWMTRLFRPDAIFAEKNHIGVVFAQDFAYYHPLLPLVPRTTTGNKHQWENGIPSMKGYIENNAIMISYGDTDSKKFYDTWAREFNGIIRENGKVKSVVAHDDCVISTWYTVQGAKEIDYGMLQVFEGIGYNDLKPNSETTFDERNTVMTEDENSLRAMFR